MLTWNLIRTWTWNQTEFAQILCTYKMIFFFIKNAVRPTKITSIIHIQNYLPASSRLAFAVPITNYFTRPRKNSNESSFCLFIFNLKAQRIYWLKQIFLLENANLLFFDWDMTDSFYPPTQQKYSKLSFGFSNINRQSFW